MHSDFLSGMDLAGPDQRMNGPLWYKDSCTKTAITAYHESVCRQKAADVQATVSHTGPTNKKLFKIVVNGRTIGAFNLLISTILFAS